MRIFPGKRPTAMSIEKPRQWIRQQDIANEQEAPATLHNMRMLQGLQGVNTAVQTYVAMVGGTSGESLWSINFSTRPGQQKRLLTVLACTMNLVNFGIDTFPTRVNLVANEVTPTLDQQGQPSHVIAVMCPGSAAVPVSNPGITGYNVLYTKHGEIPPVDVTGSPTITFDITSDNSTVPTPYPLTSPITIIVQVTHVML